MTPSKNDKRGDRERYEPPVLTAYGTIRDLTQSNVSMGMNDMIVGPEKTG